MAKLSMFLPPFAGDYSGAAGVLFGFNSLNVIVDASCCTHNYTSNDEPRWKSRHRATLGAQLRTLEATLGDDMRLLDQAEAAQAELRAPCIVLIGTPVPAVVGMDLDGLSWELEDRCGVPAFGVDTTGFETYEQGASKAQVALVRKFAGESAEGREGDGAAALRSREGAGCADGVAVGAGEGAMPADGSAKGLAANSSSCKRVNLLGATVHDFGSAAAMQVVENAVRAQGCELAWSTADDYVAADVAAASTADESLVVTWSGLAAARDLQERFGVPYSVGVPDAALRAVPGVATLLEAAQRGDAFGSPLLIVHDQVIANSLRDALRACGVSAPIAVASLFAMDSAPMQPGDFRITCENDLIAHAAAHPETVIAGDPLLRRLPAAGKLLRWELPHEAVSSTLFL